MRIPPILQIIYALFAVLFITLTVLHFHQGINFSIFNTNRFTIPGVQHPAGNLFAVFVAFVSFVLTLNIIYSALYKITVSGDVISIRSFTKTREIFFHQIRRVEAENTEYNTMKAIIIYYGGAQEVRAIFGGTSSIEHRQFRISRSISNFDRLLEALQVSNISGVEELAIQECKEENCACAECRKRK